jgi:putative transposase
MVRIAVWFGFSVTDQNRIETMTIDRLHLAELIEKGSDADLLREMMIFTVNRMMDLDVEGLTGAAYGGRSDARTNQRNGYRERPCTICTLPIAIPKLRKGSYFPPFLEARRTSDKALIAVIQEAYVHGVSTRSVDELSQVHGARWHLKKPGLAPVRGDR